MKYLAIYKSAVSDGPGVRVSLYVSGCRRHCKGCHNPESWDFSNGNDFTTVEIAEISSILDKAYIQGLTIAGGEPFEEENQPEIAKLVKLVRTNFPGKDIWIYSGYELEDLLPGGSKHTSSTDDILYNVDVAVLGPFVQEERDISTNNLWRGSRNQRVLNMPATIATGKKIYVKDIPNND